MSTDQRPLVQPLTYDAKCRLCGKNFSGSPLNGTTDPRIQQMGEALFKHFINGDQQHKTYAVVVVVMAGYILEDPAAQQFGNGVRFAALQALRRKFAPDEQIHDIVSRIQPAEVEAAMRDLRDFLTETGAHAPQFK